MSESHERPPGTSDSAVEAAGKMSEAFEKIGRARGHLLAFHQLIGEADLSLDEVIDLTRQEGHAGLADQIERELLGRNVLEGRWTFQIIEEFDDGYWTCFAEQERAVREALTGGRRHVYEAEMKEARRTHGRRGHEASPGEGGEAVGA